MRPLINCCHCRKTSEAEEIVPLARYKCLSCGGINEVLNVPIREWLGFSFVDYLAEIKFFVEKDEFSLLKAANRNELARGKLSKKQINSLKRVLKDNFDSGGSISDIRDGVLNKVNVKPLQQVDAQGRKTGKIPASIRAVSIARTETTRVANGGALAHYRKGGVEEYRWVATFGQRTCSVCEGLNGQLFALGGGPTPPAHSLCRCTVVPKTELE